MAEKRSITDQAKEPDHKEPSNITEESGFTRRDFLQQSMAVASGLALGSVLPSYANELMTAEPQACGPGPGQGFKKSWRSGVLVLVRGPKRYKPY
jgi:hypothetical protein